MATSSAKTPASPKPAAKSAPAPKKAAIGAPKVAPPSIDGQIEAGAAPGGTGAPAKPAAPLVKKKDLVARVVEALDGNRAARRELLPYIRRYRKPECLISGFQVLRLASLSSEEEGGASLRDGLIAGERGSLASVME